MLTFCTLFDSNYMDKGLVLYHSMSKMMNHFKLYILAMDEKCRLILNDMKLENAIIISLDMFEDDELLEIKKRRTRAEYCWTCTASLIDYVLEKYNEEYCTYVDSDLFFYQNPQMLLDEMINAECSVQIVEHGFGYHKKALEKEKKAGKYCVQFNTFKNDAWGRKILSVWKAQCREHCSMAPGEMGDQKYLADWPERYERVHVLQHQGGGVAPWNVYRYQLDKEVGFLKDKKTKERFELIFYHFHHLEYLDDARVNINVFTNELFTNRKLVYRIYHSYLRELESVRKELLNNYGILPLVKKHPGISNEKKRGQMSLGEFLRKVKVKIVYLLGKKKDIIDLQKVL